jgi:hypothetical protein
MAKDILKEAIADAKAVREVALANAKAALEEAFTPKLQSMLSAKLSEDLDEGMYDEDDMDEGMHDEDDMDEGHGGMMHGKMMHGGMYDEDDMDEGMQDEAYHDEDDMDEGMHDEDDMDEGMHDEDDMDEEVDLEELLNELELEEEEVLDEKEDEIEEAVGYPNYRADQIQKVKADATDVNQGLNENEEFDLDALLNEINNLEEGHCYDEDGKPMPEAHCYEENVKEGMHDEDDKDKKEGMHDEDDKDKKEGMHDEDDKDKMKESVNGCKNVRNKLNEVQAAYNAVRSELNEVNLLNSKLLYVNRIFKANNLDDSQKLRVVETLDKADSVKEAKLIYETIKDTFNVAKSKKASFKTKATTLKEGIGMASKAAGISTGPKKEIISESTNMVNRFQKLANIKINE